MAETAIPVRRAARLAPSRVGIALLAALSMAVAGVAAGDSSAADARTWYVAPTGSDGGSGSAADPLATLGHAVERAAAGDTVVLRDGVYREAVQVYGKELHIASAPGERAVLDGSRDVDSWSPSGGDWVASGWTTQFTRERSGGPVTNDRIIAGYPDQVFVDGDSQRQVLDRADVEPGTFFHDTAADQLWIGSDPTGRDIDASFLGWGIYLNEADGSTIRDITVRRYATEAADMAAIRVYADDVTVSGVSVESNARMGLSAIGSGIFVTDSAFNDNGYLGVHGDDLDGFVLENSAVLRNNREGFDDFHSGAGLKLTNSSRVTIRDNDVSFNAGPGIWLDLDANQVTVARNLAEANDRAGIEVELSDRVNVLSNVVLDNGEAGIWAIESRNVQIMHNASFGNVNGIEVEEGPRRDVTNVRVENNTIGDAAPGSRALLDINDWTANRSAADMGVDVANNAYWIPANSATPTLSRVGQWPDPLSIATDIEQHRSQTGLGDGSILSTSSVNPFVHSVPTQDYRWLESQGIGTPLTEGAAEALGVHDGDRLPIGPVAPVVRR